MGYMPPNRSSYCQDSAESRAAENSQGTYNGFSVSPSSSGGRAALSYCLVSAREMNVWNNRDIGTHQQWLIMHWLKSSPHSLLQKGLRRHQFVLENIMWQMHVLSNWTHYAFGELNTQFQQVSKMIL
ncbi:uncharacterized protein ACIBXB_006499 isoform 1-T1 [Morphnus guianensis]